MLSKKQIISATGTLLTGSALASLISLAALPLLTHIYTPDIMGAGAVYLAFHSLLTVIASGRYSMAIPLPKRDITAIHIFWLVVSLSIAVGVVSSAVFLIFGRSIAEILTIPELIFWSPFLGLSVTAAGILEAVNYWLIRQKQYKRRAALAILQTFILISCQLLAGLIIEPDVDVYMMGLVTGLVFSMFVVIVANIKYFTHSIRWSRVQKISVYFFHLPKYLFTTSFPNTASVISLPLVISAASGPSISAIYFISSQLVSKPLGLISSALWQVVYGVLGDNIKDEKGNVRFLTSVYYSTTFIYTIPLLFIVSFPEIIKGFLGEQWGGVYEVMIIYLSMAYFQHSSNSISYFQIFGKYKEEAYFNIFLIFIRLSLLLIAGLLGLDGIGTIFTFCIFSALVYLVITGYWSKILKGNLVFLKVGVSSFFVPLFYGFLISNYIESVFLKSILIVFYMAVCFKLTKVKVKGV